MGRHGSARRTRRGIALVAVVLHVLLVGVLPVADAALSRADHGARLAAEEPDASPRSGHDHLQCQFCRGMGTPAVPIVAAADGAPAVTFPVALLADGESVAPAVDRGVQRSRAPPIA